jgi:hypothetical protein
VNKRIPFTKKNEYGYWVGCIKYPDGVEAVVSNAKLHESDALDIATRCAEQANKYDAEKEQHQ